jgi:asparagine synthase (glutamine-hydrolysing)
MCGISGYIALNDQNHEASLLIQQHRGPDAKGKFLDEIAGKKICLQHTRLSIIDLSEAGRQPMVTEDKTCVIIYNGEVYNFLELKKKYLSAYHFHSRTDTEVILNLYHKLGIAFLKELNGDFAIAILDKRINRLFLARDHFGVKPLYFFDSLGGFYYGSEIKAILGFGIDPVLDKEAIENYLVFKYSPQNSTLFSGIQALPPAHYLELDIVSGKYAINSFWLLSKKWTGKIFRECSHELFDLMSDAVNIRLMADVPVGTFFSGGIDSSIIASFLRDKPQITHYTARKSQNDLAREGTSSDFYYAERLAHVWGLHLIPVDIGSQEANHELINTSVYFGDDLIADGSQIPSYLITREARKSSVVILSGMGADELFYGYKGHQLAFIADKLDRLPSILTNPVTHVLAGLNQGKGLFKPYKRHLRQFGKYYNKGSLKYGFFGIVGDYDNAVSLLKSPQGSALKVFGNYFGSGGDVFDNLFHFERENFLVKNLHYVDRMCMANSMEARVPFLDYRVAEFAYNLPVNYKLSGTGTTKRILKDAFKVILPPKVIHRRKAGFGMPLRSIFSSEAKVYELLELEFYAGFNEFNADAIKLIVNNHISGKEDNAALIYALISFRLWHRMWFEGGYKSFLTKC